MLHPTAEKLSAWLGGYHFNQIVVSTVSVLLLTGVTAAVDPDALSSTVSAIIFLSPVWLPLYLAIIFWIEWMHYIRYISWFGIDSVLLEIQLPPDVPKSPLSMELFLISLFNTGGETTFINRFWKGGFRPIFSLEIASNEGRINFYIHARRIWRNAIEARLYGQFPDAKVREVDDYVNAVDFNLDEYELWAGEYRKPNAGALPILTYVDFGLDKDTDTPETKVDPITNLMELFNNMGKGEHLWFQIVMKGRGRDEWYGIYDTKHNKFVDDANAEIQKVMVGAAARAQKVLKASDIVDGKMNALLTDLEKKKIEAIEHSLGKQIYECGFRVVYVAKKEKFFGYTGAHTYAFFRPFISPFNELRGTRGLVAFDYPWEDFMGIRKAYVKKQLFFFYKYRAFFYVPHDQEPVFMNTEELATLWHFPGSATKTPGIDRVPSRSAEAPINLPTGE